MQWFHIYLRNSNHTINLLLSSVAINDMVQKYLIPAMKNGSLKILAAALEHCSSVESIFRELPHAKVEELAITMEYYPHSEEVR